MRKKTTRDTLEQNKWRLPKWGTPIVEYFVSECMGTVEHLSRKQAEEFIYENAAMYDPAISPRKQFEIIVKDFKTRIEMLDRTLKKSDVFFK